MEFLIPISIFMIGIIALTILLVLHIKRKKQIDTRFWLRIIILIYLILTTCGLILGYRVSYAALWNNGYW
jgi:hypothetical protein